jgi:hypothetical protein
MLSSSKKLSIYKTLIISISLLILSSFTAFSQQVGSIKGIIYEDSSGDPAMFTNVYLKGTTIGASTDINGYYSITKIPVGNYTLMVTSLGFDTIAEPIEIKAGQTLSKNLSLKESNVQLDEFEVSAEREEARTEVKMSVNKITPKEIKVLPSIGGEPDLAQYLQVLPGVVFTGDQGGQLYIRGGAPVQNKVLLDGMIVYQAFHSIGLFSVFDTDIIRNADVYTGGFGAQYGGRISSIMDITTTDGNKKRHSGKISVNPFGSRAMLQGPIKKAVNPDDASITYVLSAKTSYLEETSKLLYTYIDEEGLPFNFTDLYGKVSFNSGGGSKFSLFGFNFSDRVNYQALSNMNWDSWGAGGSFVLVPDGSDVLISGNLGYSEYMINMREDGTSAERFSSINSFNTNLNFKYFIKENELNYGIEIAGFNTDFSFVNAVNRTISQKSSTTELAGYVTYRIVAGLFVIEPGFRAQHFASLSTFSPEPRIGVKYNVNETFRLKGAAGMYAQNLISAISDRDVVNLFQGFLSGPDNLQRRLTNPDGSTRDITHALQKANHYILGFEYDFTNKLNLNVEGYIKDFTQLTNLNRNKIFEDNPANFDKPEVFRKDFIIETGAAMGIDFALKYASKKTYLWFVYSLGKIDRWDGVIEYHPIFDRRHNVNVVGSQKFGKEKDWEFNVRWNYGSGFPFTQTAGYYEQFNFTDGINTDYTSANGDLGILYGGLFEGRLPDYHRLDITIKKTFEISKNSKIEVNAGATNIYNRRNIFYFDRVRFDRVDQLPFLPSIGFNWTF